MELKAVSYRMHHFFAPLCSNTVPADGGRELFKPPNNAESHSFKIIGLNFRPFWPTLAALGPNTKSQILDSSFESFLKRTERKSASLQPLVGFLAFAFQMLWRKSINLINSILLKFP